MAETKANQTFHLRVKQLKRGKPGYSANHYASIHGTPEARTVCGAAPTDIDVASPRLLASWTSATRGEMTACRECREALR